MALFHSLIQPTEQKGLIPSRYTEFIGENIEVYITNRATLTYIHSYIYIYHKYKIYENTLLSNTMPGVRKIMNKKGILLINLMNSLI